MKKINRGLLELLTGILLSGVCFSLMGFLIPLFIKISMLRYTISLWLGVLVAFGFAVYMQRCIEKAFCLEESGAGRVMATGFVVRYLLAAVFLIAVFYSGKGYILASFLGLMCLKTGAYLQPLSHKIWNFFIPEEISGQNREELPEELPETKEPELLLTEEQEQGGE